MPRRPSRKSGSRPRSPKCPPAASRSRSSSTSTARRTRNFTTACSSPSAASPNADDLGLENTKVSFDDRGFINVNEKQQTTDPAIYAIGDIAGGVLLAHKAAKEARIAVEVITGEDSAFADITIPAVVFTDPEVAWCGLTEAEAKAKGIAVAGRQIPLGRLRPRAVL